MNVRWNGEARDVPSGSTVAQLLGQLGYDGEVIAVALNEEFLPRSAYETTFVKESDAIEVVAPLQGG